MPLPAPGADSTRFLGQQRDQTKLDQFGARYYSMFTGRFTGVDPVINPGAVGSPQRWNRYAYALNNPLRFTDTSGLDTEGGDTEILIPPCIQDCQAAREYANLDWLPPGFGNLYVDARLGGMSEGEAAAHVITAAIEEAIEDEQQATVTYSTEFESSDSDHGPQVVMLADPFQIRAQLPESLQPIFDILSSGCQGPRVRLR